MKILIFAIIPHVLFSLEKQKSIAILGSVEILDD
jgi:hypothetical protein